jgi:phospholipase C
MWKHLEKAEIARRSLTVDDEQRPRTDFASGSDLIPEIKHIVVLMMENHAYDNYLGMLGRGDGFTLDADGAPTAVNHLPDGRQYRAHHFPSTAQEGGDPTQTWHASHIQYGSGDNGGFAASIADTVPGADPGMPMGYWTDADIPFAAAGTLPAFSLVDPDFGAYSEENPQDISHGESFAAAVVDAVMRGPAWESTLLLWIYDEHGGYYDHVPPPEAVAPDDVPARNWQLGLPPWLRTLLKPLLSKEFAGLANADTGPAVYDRLGFRVPAVIVSPYARPDFVLHEVLDHTSVLKLLEEKWNLPPLTRRDAAAMSPLAALDLKSKPAFRVPPVLPVPKAGPFHPSRRARTNREPGRRSARRS